MKKNITRRHFLSSTAALVGATALTACQSSTYRALAQGTRQAMQAAYYPPALTGLRGDHDGSFPAAHSVALRGAKYALPNEASEQYDLVVVGAGISGLAAAYAYQKKHPQHKILILDNHDDFGGHAKRNEFKINGRTMITYGGSENIDSPASAWSEQSLKLLRELGVDYEKFHVYFQQDLYTKQWGLQRGIFFNAKTFGQAKLVLGSPKMDAEQAAKSVPQFPFSEEDKRAALQLYVDTPNYLKGKTRRQVIEFAENTSYHDFLANTAKMPTAVLKYVQNISSDYWGHDINALSVREAFDNGYPGTQNLNLPEEEGEDEPYIYHFPDGNASITRLLVRKLIPSVASGNTMEDIVTAKFDYNQLDKAEHNVRLRLNSTALLIENQADKSVAIAYLSKGSESLVRVNAKKCIYAGHATLAPRIMPQMAATQKEAMLSNVKIAMVYSKVLLKNGLVFQKMGAHHLYTPDQPYCEMFLDYPVKMGDYVPSQTPNEPVVLHAIRMAVDLQGNTARDKYRAGRRKLIAQKYEDLRNELMAQLREVFATVGVNADDVVQEITINRWGHGYSYEQVGLYDSDNDVERNTTRMRKSLGNIFMANSDVAWMPYAQNAIDEGLRAANEAAK